MELKVSMLDERTVQEMLWKFALSSPEHVVLLLDAAGVVTWANTGAAKILGAPPEQLIGLNFSAFFTSSDARKGIPQHELEVALQSGTASDDRWMARIDRSRFWATGVTVHLGTTDERCTYLKLFRDLTELKMQLETARQRSRSASAKEEQMAAAIALVAHELRNPLAGIGLGFDLLTLRVPAQANTATAMKAISANIKLAGQLVDDLMEHSKVSSKAYTLERAPCTLRELLDASVAIALQQTNQGGRPVSVLVPSGDIDMAVDRMRMQQVFVNLVANALRYTPPPGRIWVAGTIEGAEVVVRISDEGVGIDPLQLGKLFDAFTGVGVIGTKLGLGLGLALVKKIVELHGGSVQARSEGVGKGSQFIARFPAGVAQTGN